MFLIVVFDKAVTCALSVSSQDFYSSLPIYQSRDVTPRLGVCYSPVYFFPRMQHLHSGYYCYDYVVIGVLRAPEALWFIEILFELAH